ncbi:hypothetical protein N1F89_05540 [Aquibium sp. A9E412]|uniref:hypothetical protein n=1 Tax=Aquibium sp. A9E412 TaxID=2976767 RepID=UPI0025AF2B34|nr:hypothetical protein [Aquibium sp. A9E412]MDN2565677.1 hypothetical protein [Aquibium sp. A9E412]
MRSVFVVLSAFLLFVLPARAAPDDGPPTFQQQHEERLDTLFADLKRERNETAAKRIAGRIQEEWNRSGSDTADLLMRWAYKAMREREFAVALDFLDQVVVQFPGYAEGWNRRATVHFMMDNHAKAMADIARTLALEPRHFGALAGLAGILKANGDNALALDAYRRVLAVYPMMREAQEEVAELAEEIAGENI